MKKLGIISGDILVSLTNKEFLELVGSHSGNVPDGAVISIGKIAELADLFVREKDKLLKLAGQAEGLAADIKSLVK